jgi:hypothetical protein
MSQPAPAFHHEAFVYESDAAFLAGAVPFVRDGQASREPVLVALPRARVDLLRTALGGDAALVRFVDMEGIGGNPARIIPLWQEFVSGHPVSPGLRGMGEPIWAGRSEAELGECVQHELLLNVAFDGGPPWWLLCPYDASRLDTAVLDEARRTHPHLLDGAGHHPSRDYAGTSALGAPPGSPLTDPPAGARDLVLGPGSTPPLHDLVAALGRAGGVDASRTEHLLMAVLAAASDAAPGGCTARVWTGAGGLTCEIRYAEPTADPLAGRRIPVAGEGRSRGLWLANQLCDLVELRSSAAGTVIRLHVNAALPRPASANRSGG